MEQNQMQYDVNMFGRKESDDFNKYIQDPSRLIKDLDMYLSGERLIFKNDAYFQDKIPNGRRMNDKGRELIKARLRTYLNSNTYMSGIDPKEVANVYRIDAINFIFDLFTKLEEYETDVDTVEEVANQVCPVIYFALLKSTSDKQAIYQTMRSSNVQPAPQIPNPFGSIIPPMPGVR